MLPSPLMRACQGLGAEVMNAYMLNLGIGASGFASPLCFFVFDLASLRPLSP